MKILGSFLVFLGIVSLVYLAIIFDGPMQPEFLIGYFAVPIIILAVGTFLLFKSGLFSSFSNISGFKVSSKKEKYTTSVSRKKMAFNNTQTFILITAAVLIILSIFFPPTYYSAYDNLKGKTKVFSGYRFVGGLETNTQKTQVPSLINREERVFASIYHIEPIRLSFQLLGILLVVCLLLAAFHEDPNYVST